MSGVADSEKVGLTGLVLPNEFYTIIDNSQAGASINLYKWTEYDDYGGAPAPTLINRVFNGRMTLDGSNAVTISDVTAASAIWYVPYLGNNVSLYTSGSVWNTIVFNPASLVLTGLSPNSNYDVWGYQNVSELSLLTTRWNVNDTARVNGLSAQDGIQTEALNRTRVYLGTIRITGTSAQSEDYAQKETYNGPIIVPYSGKLITPRQILLQPLSAWLKIRFISRSEFRTRSPEAWMGPEWLGLEFQAQPSMGPTCKTRLVTEQRQQPLDT